MKYLITTDNYLHKGEMLKSDNQEAFVLYDIDGKKFLTSVMSVAREFDTLEEALEFQKEKKDE